ncbi:985_t:CDS:2 [Acaulospora morrowiae]|uniref:985_t:CDS:1 n=1 Tax=Acaulospora morrowiae TaxID=94023 RepID=A0A9N9ARW3_9GLOM|nr:985_t:CDS:2 [Acaulospora morrowiae]
MNPLKWFDYAIDNGIITEVNYDSLKKVEPFLITSLSCIKKAYQTEFNRNIALKYLKDDGHKSANFNQVKHGQQRKCN